MTWRKREIMEMAREAGGIDGWGLNGKREDPELNSTCFVFDKEDLEAFAKLVREEATAKAKANESWVLVCELAVAAEREACAKVCEQSAQNYYPAIPEASGACTHLADAIRARGQA
jgi:hypothetical protein